MSLVEIELELRQCRSCGDCFRVTLKSRQFYCSNFCSQRTQEYDGPKKSDDNQLVKVDTDPPKTPVDRKAHFEMVIASWPKRRALDYET